MGTLAIQTKQNSPVLPVLLKQIRSFIEVRTYMPLWGFGQPRTQGSAFAVVAEADAKVAEARGRISALDAAHKLKHEIADELDHEVSRVHLESARVHSRLDDILVRL